MRPPSSLLLASAAVAAAFTAQAQYQPYLKLDGGAAFQQGLNAKGGAKLDFDIGARFDLAAGCQLAESLSAELEVGVIRTTLDSIGGLSVSTFGGSADFYQVPVLANLIYTLPLKGSFHPYIGAGIGGVATVIDLSTPLGNIHDTDFVFGYQAQAGVKLALSENVDLGVAYKFLGTTDHHWSDHGLTLDTDPTHTHSVLLTLSYRF